MKVVITDWDLGSDEAVRRVLEPAGFDVVVQERTSVDELVKLAADADALMVRYANLPRDVLSSLDSLRFVSRLGIGPWGVDLDAAVENKVAVADCPEYCTDEAVAHTLALVLGMNRRLDVAREAARQGYWRSYGQRQTILPLSELTLGLIGVGRVGQGVATAARALGMDVIGYDPYLLNSPQDVEMVDLETLLTDSDFVCLLCPDTPETQGMIDAAALARMKANSYLINTARGALVDEEALLSALDSGQIAGAALDVLNHEPPPRDHPLLHHPNVWVTPHVGFYSEQSRHELKVYASRTVIHYFTGERVASLLTPDFRRV